MASVDAKDTTWVDIAVPDYEAAIGKPLAGLKIGIPKEYRVDGMPEEIEKLWQQGIAWLKDHTLSSIFRCRAYEICAAGLLHRCAGGGFVEPRPL